MARTKMTRYVAFVIVGAHTACGGRAESGIAGGEESAAGSGGVSAVTVGGISSGPTGGFGDSSVTSGTTVGGVSVGTFGAGGSSAFGAGGSSFFGAGGGVVDGFFTGPTTVSTSAATTGGYAGQAGAPSVADLCEVQCDVIDAAASALGCEGASVANCLDSCRLNAGVVADYGCADENVAYLDCVTDLGPDGFVCYPSYISAAGCYDQEYTLALCLYYALYPDQ